MARRAVRLLVFAALFVLLLAWPAGAQEDGGGATANAGDVQIQYQDCDQIVAAAAEQLNAGDAGAVAGDAGGAAASEIAQELGVSVAAVQSCLQAAGGIGGPGQPGGDGTGETPQEEDGDGDQGETGTAPTDGDGGQSVEEMKSQVLADTIPSKVLPVTGGAHPGALLAGALLAGAGLLLLARRR